jgi:hypothetical protein
MKFACLVYYEEQKLEGLSEAEKLTAIVAECNAAAAWTEELKKDGHHVFSAGLQSARTARTVRSRDGRRFTTDGPYAETKECLGGFTIIDARDHNEALRLVGKFPAGLISIEVRPLMDQASEPIDPVDQKIVAAVRSGSSP